jgi:hypothetical protein
MQTKATNNHSHKDGLAVWMPTASPTIERCGRAGCRATRQLVNGVWTEAQAHKPTPTTVAEQPRLWS